MTELFYRLLK